MIDLRHLPRTLCSLVLVLGLATAGCGTDEGSSAGGGGSGGPGGSQTNVSRLVFTMGGSASLVAALQVEVHYLRSDGAFVGPRGGVDCDGLVQDAMSAFNHEPGGLLIAGMVVINGVQGPADVFTCRFESDRPVEAADFAIAVVDASDLRSSPIHPRPAVVLTQITPSR